MHPSSHANSNARGSPWISGHTNTRVSRQQANVMQHITAPCAAGDPEPMEDRADNGDAAHVPGCGLADNIDVRLARLTQLFYCGALQVLLR